MSRERSIDVSGDGTVLWRLLLEKENNMQIKTHQKNINYNMLGLRLGRLALGSLHCSKFNKTQCTLAELAAADHSWDRFGCLSTSGQVREWQKEHTHTRSRPGQCRCSHPSETPECQHCPGTFLLPHNCSSHSWLQAAAVQNAVPEVQLEEPLPIPSSELN